MFHPATTTQIAQSDHYDRIHSSGRHHSLFSRSNATPDTTSPVRPRRGRQ